MDRCARSEFAEDSGGWKVIEVRRSSGSPDQAELVLESITTGKPKVIFIDRAEFAEENDANGSRLSDVGFNFSIRLMEFHHIRGFEEFADESVMTLELYPPDRQQPMPPLPEGWTRDLRSPFH